MAELTGLETGQILKPGKQPARVNAGSLLCHWAIRSLGMSAATRAACRGEAIAAADTLNLVEVHNA